MKHSNKVDDQLLKSLERNGLGIIERGIKNNAKRKLDVWFMRNYKRKLSLHFFPCLIHRKIKMGPLEINQSRPIKQFRNKNVKSY